MRKVSGRYALLAVGAALAMSGCAASTQEAGRSRPEQPVPDTVLATSIPPGTQQVAPAEPLVVTAQHGTLVGVTVTGADGKPLPGLLDPLTNSWTSSPLAWGTGYRVRATGRNADGKHTTLTSSFSTLPQPELTLEVERVRPAAGEIVGIAMPVSISFDRPVTDRAAVQRRLEVVTSVPTEGSFHWFSDRQVNWRPKEYWKPGTSVTVHARLYGVATGDGVFGAEDFSSGFGIGRDQRVFGDVNARTLTAFVDGVEVRSMRASYGQSVHPTPSGIHVAFERHRDKPPRSDSGGGQTAGVPGYYDLTREDGTWFSEWVQPGDPVEIVGSSRPLTPADGDIIADWAIPWEEYVAGSALPPPPPPAPTAPTGAVRPV
ncbi:MAG: L,D-transpeptidase [Pseudonocardiaceae bacterium]